MAEIKSREWLLENAVLCWMHHYPGHTWTQQYTDLLDELKSNTQVRKRGRPAKKARTKAPSKDTAS